MKWQPIDSESDKYILTLTDGEGWWRAGVKWDGCINLTRYFNVPYGAGVAGDSDTLHICNVDELIELLQELKDQARRCFGTWPG